MVFDTTYCTNRYNLICAPFVGVNHHWQNVIFGCAFLLDETTASFKWLFKSFLDSMGNQSPITIFTNQDQAMSNAVEEVTTTSFKWLFKSFLDSMGNRSPITILLTKIKPCQMLFRKCF